MLPRAQRLRKNKDFQAVYQRRQVWSASFLTLYVRRRPFGTGPVRVGVVVSKKTARRAHDRNRIKRRLTEICRTSLLGLLLPDKTTDLLFVARSGAADASYAEFVPEAEGLLRRAGLLSDAALSSQTSQQG
jgi:ribonuclease P protein component